MINSEEERERGGRTYALQYLNVHCGPNVRLKIAWLERFLD